MNPQKNSKASAEILLAFIYSRDLVNCKTYAYFSFSLGKSLRDKSFIGAERDQISRYLPCMGHIWVYSQFISTVLHCKTALEIYSCSRKHDPLPFATMIDDNVKPNFKLTFQKLSLPSAGVYLMV